MNLADEVILLIKEEELTKAVLLLVFNYGYSPFEAKEAVYNAI